MAWSAGTSRITAIKSLYVKIFLKEIYWKEKPFKEPRESAVFGTLIHLNQQILNNKIQSWHFRF